MTNGVLWPTLFQGDEDNIRKILYGSWLIRDWDFATTSLTGFTPFGSDGNLVNTLFDSDNPGGRWYDVGYMDEKGPEFTPKLDVKPTKVMQSRWPARYDYTGQTEEIGATLMENNPVVDALYNNAALSNLQAIGTPGYNVSAPVELDLRWRQCMFIGVDGRSGLNYYIVRIYPKVLIGDFGKIPWNIENAAHLPIKGFAVPDSYTIPPDGVNVGSPRWTLRDGPAWRQQGEGLFETTAPIAAAVTGLKATISFPTPAGLTAPVTYTASQQLTSGDSFTNSTLSGSPTVSGNTTTITVSGLTASTLYNAFKVTATDADSLAITSPASNPITSTAS
ncbi:hypothetical protein [Mycobacterium intracellulare]|uniref:hypothetical protein n=1 Tax=Mycobacterium intracellulare TaxID=1767 RepID=UPI00109E800F|nr:hypothetical protein [Mycobacterium intracellulare]